MIEIDFGKKYKKQIILALGFFDSIHIGHRKILEKVKMLAEEKNYYSAVMTFNNNPDKIISNAYNLVYSYEERLFLLDKLNLDVVLHTNFNNDFKNITANNFLKILTENLNIKHIVCGYDYRYGKNASGNVETLKEYLTNKGIEIEVIPEINFNNKKISSTIIRNYIKKGEIDKANKLLGSPYFVKGKVIHGRNVGSKMLYPTINLEINNEKLKIKNGVYCTITQIEGKKFFSVTNCGEKPSFNNDKYDIETYLLDFEGNLYNKTVNIIFIERLRDIIKFENIENLKKQINIDIINVKKIKDEGNIVIYD